jgi:UPF0042 nucleotide-binding protein
VTATEDLNAQPQAGGVTLTVSSFGYKYGPIVEADWVADARILRNPFWEEELRPLTGLDEPVRDYVLQQPAARELIARLTEMLVWACARSGEHGRAAVHAAIGCTGGRHRSVVIASELAGQLRAAGVPTTLHHRDVERPDPR